MGGATRPGDRSETGGNLSAVDQNRQGGRTVKKLWNRLLEQLLLVRLGQELGTNSELAQAIAGGIDYAIRFVGVFCP